MLKTRTEREDSNMASSPSKASDSTDFVKKIGYIVDRIADEESHDSPIKKGTENLTQADLAELSLLCTIHSNLESQQNQTNVGFNTVEPEQLIAIVGLLDRQINKATGIKIIEAALEILQATDSPSQASQAIEKWFQDDTEGTNMVEDLRKGLQAATIVLSLATVKTIDRRVVNEDTIEAVITLYRTHLHKNIVPALNQTGHVTLKKDDNINMSPSKKRKRSQSMEGISFAKDLKKVYKHLQTTIQPLLRLMNQIERLVGQVSLDDQQILLITSASLSSFEIDCILGQKSHNSVGQQLQLASIDVITAAFRRYPSHRDTMIEDLFPLMLRLPTGKRSLRAFTIRYDSMALATLNESIHTNLVSQQPHCIQMITGLLLSMIQACVNRPTIQRDDELEEEGLVSGLQSCQIAVENFVSQILKRCRQSKATTTDFRPILSNIIDDLLLCYLLPEYPASEMVLYSIVRHILKDLSSLLPSVKSPSKVQLETTYLNHIFDILGRIGAMEARVLALARSRSIEAKTEYEEPDEDEVIMMCHCGRNQKGFGLGCDRCGIFYHATCVGVARENVPDTWFCDPCRLANSKERQTLSMNENLKSSVDDSFILNHSLLSYLITKNDDLSDPIAFRSASWIDGLESKSIKSLGKSRNLILALIDSWPLKATAESLTDEGNMRVIVSLASQSDFIQSFRQQMGFILEIMSDDAPPAIRKLSIKAVENIVAGDPELMLMPVVKKAVSSRLADETISVREAAVSLIGLYVEKFPSVAASFQASLLECLADSGVSVRKRTIRIFQSLLVSNPDYPARSAIYYAMMKCAQQPKEEESVGDLIIHIFEDLWLRDSSKGSPSPKPATSKGLYSPTKSMIDSSSEEKPGLVTPTTPSKTNRKARSNFDRVAEQMMEVVRISGDSEGLEALLTKLIGSEDEDEEKKSQRTLNLCRCESIANSLFDLLLRIEDIRTENTKRAGKDMAATLKTLAVFANIVPQTVFQHFESLLPYLKADNGVSLDEESAIIGAICEMLFSIASVMDVQYVRRLEKTPIAKDIQKIAYRFGGTTLSLAIQALCTLTNQSEVEGAFRKSFLALARTFYSFLSKRQEVNDMSTIDAKTRNNVFRSLAVLGHMCRFKEASSGFDVALLDDHDLPDAPSLSESNFVPACYRIFLRFLRKKDTETKCASMHALGELFVSNPKLMLDFETRGTMGKILSEKMPTALQLEALKSFKSILDAEEKRSAKGKKVSQAANQAVTTSSCISGDQDGDATLFGGVLTEHADQIFDMALSTKVELRRGALGVIEALLRQGLVNPNEAIPFLYALQGDVNNLDIRTTALKLLISEGEKRPEALRQRVAQGVKEAYKFQSRLLAANTEEVSAVVSDSGAIACIFDQVYNECIASSRKQRHGLSSSLLSLFSSSGGKLGRETAAKDLRFLAFVAQLLAHLPYKSLDDPLFIIHVIDSTVNLEGSAIVDKFADILRPVGLASEDVLDDALAAEDALERAAKSKFPSRTQEARALSSDDFDMDTFMKLCRDAASLALLLRLKSFLRSGFNLSESRCMEYDSSMKEKLSDKGIGKINHVKPFDIALSSGLLKSSSFAEKDALIRQYAEFRRLMREESSLDTEDDDIEVEDASDEKTSKKRSIEK